jgi:NADH dehydrogenase FAD-containing subunit
MSSQLSCTGQTPNTSILNTFLPEAISKRTGRILVKPTLQLQLGDESAFPNVFALGDVAEHGGPRMARAVYVQAGIVRDNVLELIRGGSPSHQYSPQFWFEGSIQLTIGKVSSN